MSLCLTVGAQAGLLFSYSRLAVKDLDQMNKLVLDKIKESKHEHGGDKTVPLKEALQAVFSRPNEDFLIEKILPPLHNELDELGTWEKAIKALVKESLGALHNAKAFTPQAQVTYAIFLENLVTELKPKVADDFERGIIKQISDAKVELTKEAIAERQLRMMKESVSPSAIAQAVLDGYEAAQASAAAEAAAKASRPDGAAKNDATDKDKDKTEKK